MHPSQCSFCGHGNPVSAKFCNECGSPLHLAVCACRAVNEVTAARCHKCGAQLKPARPAPLSADLDDLASLVEAQLKSLEQDVKDLARPEPQHAPPAAAPVSNNPPPVASGRPAPADRRPRSTTVAIVLAAVLAAGAGAYLHQLQQSASRPTAANSAAGVAPPVEVAGTGAPGEVPAQAAMNEAPRPDAPVHAYARQADAESAAYANPSPIGSEPPATPTPALREREEPAVPAGAGAEASDRGCPPSVVAMALCDRMASAAGQ